jgi:hypothetical protein
MRIGFKLLRRDQAADRSVASMSRCEGMGMGSDEFIPNGRFIRCPVPLAHAVLYSAAGVIRCIQRYKTQPAAVRLAFSGLQPC